MQVEGQTVQLAQDGCCKGCGNKVALVRAGACDQLLQRAWMKQLEENMRAHHLSGDVLM